MVDKKDKKKKAKKTPKQKQKQKQKQSVVVNVNMTKPATRRRTLAKKPGSNLPPGPPPQSYGIPIQQSVQPSLNNITEYLKQKEGQENNRHVNIMAAMKAIERNEGTQGTITQTATGAGTSTQAPAAKPAVAKPSPVSNPPAVAKSTPPMSILDFFGGKGLPERLRPPPPKRTKSEPSQKRKDAGVPRGPLFKTANKEALKHGYALQSVKVDPVKPAPVKPAPGVIKPKEVVIIKKKKKINPLAIPPAEEAAPIGTAEGEQGGAGDFPVA